MFEFNSTIQSSSSLTSGTQPALQAKDANFVSRELGRALARSVAAVSRGHTPESSLSPEHLDTRAPAGLPVQEGGLRLDGGALGGTARDKDRSLEEELEQSESQVLSLQEGAKRRLRQLDRMHANAEEKIAGATLLNPAAFQPRGAALNARVAGVACAAPVRDRTKSHPQATKAKPVVKKGPNKAIWRHELELLESDLHALAANLDTVNTCRQQKMQAWETNLRERESAIEAFQTPEFIEFALSSAQTAQQISNKEEELKQREEELRLQEGSIEQEKQMLSVNIEEMKQIRAQLEKQEAGACKLSDPDKDHARTDKESPLDWKTEQLRLWDQQLHAREQQLQERELALERNLLSLKERQRSVEVKYMTMQELKGHLHQEFEAWEDELSKKEKRLDGHDLAPKFEHEKVKAMESSGALPDSALRDGSLLVPGRFRGETPKVHRPGTMRLSPSAMSTLAALDAFGQTSGETLQAPGAQERFDDPRLPPDAKQHPDQQLRNHLCEIKPELFNRACMSSRDHYVGRDEEGPWRDGETLAQMNLQHTESPKKHPQYLSRHREKQMQALTAALDNRGKENARLTVNFM